MNSLTALFLSTFFTELGCKSGSSKMPTRKLGRTDLSVSLLGFGCGQLKDKDVYIRAVEMGINYFHMAVLEPGYNLHASEALRPYRAKLNIAHTSHAVPSKNLFLKDLDSFLRQSHFDNLDIWFALTPKPEELVEFNEAVCIARKAGKIRWAGISSHSLGRDVIPVTSSDSQIDVVMMAYNYLSTLEDREILNKFHQAGLGIIPMKPLAGKFYQKSTDNPAPLIRWLASDTRIHTLPISMNLIFQVEQNAATIMQTFSKEDRDILQDLYSYNSSRFCRMCGSCEGKCPHGLAISDLIRTSMYVEGYQDKQLAVANVSLIPENKRMISCDSCEKCAVICPNGVAVKELVSIMKKWLA